MAKKGGIEFDELLKLGAKLDELAGDDGIIRAVESAMIATDKYVTSEVEKAISSSKFNFDRTGATKKSLEKSYEVAQIADTESMGFCQGTEVLSDQQGITGRIDKGDRIIISRFSLTTSAPLAETVEIGTEREYHRSTRHHWLVKVCRSQFGFHLRVAGYHYTIKLHVTHGRSTERFFEQLMEQISRNVILLILTDGPSILYTIHILSVFYKDKKEK